jgi:hypothetical protein
MLYFLRFYPYYIFLVKTMDCQIIGQSYDIHPSVFSLFVSIFCLFVTFWQLRESLKSDEAKLPVRINLTTKVKGYVLQRL